MMNEERVQEEIMKLDALRRERAMALHQTEGALAAMQAVLDPESIDAAAAAADAEVAEYDPDAEEE